jgi:hypothetical protein
MRAFVGVSKAMVVAGGAVDPEMNAHGFVRICGTVLSTPEDIFTLNGGGLGVWNVQDGDFKVIPICLRP